MLRQELPVKCFRLLENVDRQLGKGQYYQHARTYKKFWNQMKNKFRRRPKGEETSNRISQAQNQNEESTTETGEATSDPEMWRPGYRNQTPGNRY